MSYITRDDIAKLIQPSTLIKLLDDDRDGVEDTGVVDGVCDAASKDFDSGIGGRLATPLATPPEWVAQAVALLAGYILYARRDTPDSGNPFAARAQAVRDRLAAIARGETSLEADAYSESDIELFDNETLML